MTEENLIVSSEANVGAGSSEAAYQEYKRLKKEEQDSIDWSKAKVGSAGLYWEPDEEGETETTAKLVEKDGSETIITTSIDIGIMKKGNNLSMSVEQGIADYVKELADEETNHLPNTKVGVMMYYLSEGIARDFGTTWSKAPASLGGGNGRGGGSKEGRAAGKRVMSKKEKNELLAKLDMAYYMDDIQVGNITMEDAFAQIKAAMDKKVEVEKLGYYLSPNKTEGVLMYDWKGIVDETYMDVENTNHMSASAFYVKNKFEVTIPNLFDTYFADDFKGSNKKLTTEVSKSPLMMSAVMEMAKYNVKGMTNSGYSKEKGSYKPDENKVITSNEDILRLVGHKKKGEVVGIHLVKNKLMGFMKPRWVCVDEVVKGKQHISLYGPNGETSNLNQANIG